MRTLCIFFMCILLSACTSSLLYSYAKPKDKIDHVFTAQIESAYAKDDGSVEVCFTRKPSDDNKAYSVLLQGSMLAIRSRGFESIAIPWKEMSSGCQRKGVPIDVVRTSKQMCETRIGGKLIEPAEMDRLTVLGPGPNQDAVADILYPPSEAGHRKKYSVTIIPEKSKDYSKSYLLLFIPFSAVFDVVTSPIQGLFYLLLKDMPKC